MDPEERLVAGKVELPPPVGSKAKYRPVVRVGALLYVSGQGPFGPSEGAVVGIVGETIGLDEAKHAARLAGLNVLSAVRADLGTLASVRRVVKLTVFVRCMSGFGKEHLVADGASEILSEVIGDDGLGARSAVGVADLPFGICVEVEAILETSMKG